MLGFCGTYNCTIDDKGRLLIPAKIQPGDFEAPQKRGIAAGEVLVLTLGLDGCLSLYPQQEWATIQSRLESLSFTKRDYRFFNRLLHQYTNPVRVDRAGRILIPEALRELAGLQKEALVIGANQAIEIWDPTRHQQYLDNFGRTFEEVAERLFQGDDDR